ncbi:septum formation family protein [Streptomyces sp. FIT100]|uniref:septum formation family protein n=1 Tax=Streptomyces sp. FIT100 TaxID=2837956 RepID=UPI0021C664DF|nr:septum formation family protein [Streptomyces sp. FIT100]UUN28885.1 septum formation family protein [Streptomyces sp. FIT100]
MLAPVASLKRGRCGATDTGLGTVAVVRPVDCAERHDIRVFAQTAVDRTFPGEQTAKDGNDFAEEQCGRAYAAAPKEWQRDGRPAGRFAFTGSSSVNVSVGETTQTSVTGEFTCYVVTS